MAKAWRRGISTREFRKCLSRDVSFIIDYEHAQHIRQKRLQEKAERERAVQQAMMEIQKHG